MSSITNEQLYLVTGDSSPCPAEIKWVLTPFLDAAKDIGGDTYTTVIESLESGVDGAKEILEEAKK